MNVIKSFLRFLKLIVFLIIFYSILGGIFRFVQDIKWYWGILLSGILIGLVYGAAETIINFSKDVTNNNKLNGILFTITNGLFCLGTLYSTWGKVLNSNDSGLIIKAVILTIIYLIISTLLSLFAFDD